MSRIELVFLAPLMNRGAAASPASKRFSDTTGLRSRRHETRHRVHWKVVPEASFASDTAALSYLRGAALPLLNLTLSGALAETARKYPDREALIVCHEGVRLTWSELDREVT